MLCIGCWIIVGGHNIRKKSEISIFELYRGSQSPEIIPLINPIPQPQHSIPQCGEKHIKRA